MEAEVSTRVKRALGKINQKFQLGGNIEEKPPDEWSLTWGGDPPGFKVSVYLGLEDDQPFFSLSSKRGAPRTKSASEKELTELLLPQFRLWQRSG